MLELCLQKKKQNQLKHTNSQLLQHGRFDPIFQTHLPFATEWPLYGQVNLYHSVVQIATGMSKNVKNTSVSEHFGMLRC
jgi:hypothetical protein